jgi:LPXTG-motif cell wall-anchored protein
MAPATLETADGRLSLDIKFSTVMLGANGMPLTSLTAQPAPSMPAPPAGYTVSAAYSLGPDGATFNPAITLTMNYDPAALPAGADQAGLVISYWNGATWENMPTTVDTENHTASAPLSHCSTYALLSPAPAAPAPQPVQPPAIVAPSPAPAPVPAPAPAPPPAVEDPVSPPEVQSNPAPQPAVTPAAQPPAQESPSASPSPGQPEVRKATGGGGMWLLVGGAVMAAVVAFVYLSRRRRNTAQ